MQIDTRMVDTGHPLESRGLFYWRGSSIRDFTVGRLTRQLGRQAT